jgi:ATP-binding cassette, subfamily B, bacterial AbcA/BmrA
MHSDRIYFLDGGRISGCGKHEELLRSHPHYAQLVARQFRNSDMHGVADEARVGVAG